MALLEAKGVSKIFGGLMAVDSMDFILEQGSICSIIGPNGAGKTTFFNTLTGIYKPEYGQITFNNHSIVGRRPEQITPLGVARTFQNIRLFGSLTVTENILVGMHPHLKQTPWGAFLRSTGYKKEEEEAYQKVRELLAFVGLSNEGDELAQNLPYGGQRRVEIARALALRPRLLLLDEPTAGMNPAETDEAITLFRRARDEYGTTLLLIEHDMNVIMEISERITVMDYGKKIAEGSPKEIRTNPHVIEAYLGRGAAAEMMMHEG
jgi:branched-chain amino acid transport system ATP-binding protein